MNSRKLLPALCALPAAAFAASGNLPVDLPPAPPQVTLTAAGPSALGADMVRANVTAITSLRSTVNRSDVGTTLQLAFSGSSALTGTRVTAVRLVKGEDDQGAKLTRAVQGSQAPRILAGGNAPASPRAGSVLVRGVTRAAEQIRWLEGEVDVVPLETKAPPVVIPDFVERSGRTLDEPALQARDLDIIPLTEATVGAHAREYLGPPLTDCGCQAAFLVRDPGNTLATLTIEDPRGRPVAMQPRARGGEPDGTLWVLFTLPNGLPEHAALRVELAATEVVRTYRFRLEDVPLP